MNTNSNFLISKKNYFKSYFPLKKFRFLFLLLSGLILIPMPQSKSEEIFLKCTGRFEINRGALIKPDWETSYLTINLDGLKSKIYDKGIKKEGRTLITRNSYTITNRDNNYRIKASYKIHRTLRTYIVDYPQTNRKLIGTCQKGRG